MYRYYFTQQKVVSQIPRGKSSLHLPNTIIFCLIIHTVRENLIYMDKEKKRKVKSYNNIFDILYYLRAMKKAILIFEKTYKKCNP
jgi:hypothetical protein